MPPLKNSNPVKVHIAQERNQARKKMRTLADVLEAVDRTTAWFARFSAIFLVLGILLSVFGLWYLSDNLADFVRKLWNSPN